MAAFAAVGFWWNFLLVFRGIYAPFEYDIPPYLVPDQDARPAEVDITLQSGTPWFDMKLRTSFSTFRNRA